MIGKVPLPTLNELGDLVLPSVAGGSETIDFRRVGGLGLAGVGAVHAMYSILSGLVSTESNPHAVLTGSDEDFSLITGLSMDPRRLPGRPEVVTTQTGEAAVEFARLEIERLTEDKDDPPWFVLLAVSNDRVKDGLATLRPNIHGDRFGAILIGECPTGITCVLNEDGLVEEITGGGTDRLHAAMRARLGRVVFDQGDVERCARDFVSYMARAAGRPELAPPDGEL